MEHLLIIYRVLTIYNLFETWYIQKLYLDLLYGFYKIPIKWWLSKDIKKRTDIGQIVKWSNWNSRSGSLKMLPTIPSGGQECPLDVCVYVWGQGIRSKYGKPECRQYRMRCLESVTICERQRPFNVEQELLALPKHLGSPLVLVDFELLDLWLSD